jgi:hypothetical protein
MDKNMASAFTAIGENHPRNNRFLFASGDPWIKKGM